MNNAIQDIKEIQEKKGNSFAESLLADLTFIWNEIEPTYTTINITINNITIFKTTDNFNGMQCLHQYVIEKNTKDVSQYRAFDMITNGQRHNDSAKARIEDAYSTVGHEKFFNIFCAAAGGTKSDFTALQVNMRLQLANNYDSVGLAKAAYGSGKGDQLSAMHYLLSGQADKKDAMDLYRACYRDDTKLFFDCTLIGNES